MILCVYLRWQYVVKQSKIEGGACGLFFVLENVWI